MNPELYRGNDFAFTLTNPTETTKKIIFQRLQNLEQKVIVCQYSSWKKTSYIIRF